MKVHSQVQQKMGAETALFTFLQRHRACAQTYRDLVTTDTLDPDLVTLLDSMHKYHETIAEEYRELLKDFPESPVKPSEQGRDNLDGVDVDLANPPMVFNFLKEKETALHETYAQVAEREGYPEPIRDLLRKSHNRVNEVIDKLDQLIKTGKDPVMTV